MYKHSELELGIFLNGIVRLAGVDEAGRGPLAGPVVAAAVIFTPGTSIEGINDSKKIGETERERLYDIILQQAASVGTGISTPQEIDSINILQASILAMHRAVSAMAIAPDYLLVDGNRFHHQSLPFQTVVKGDGKCFTIAAASIIAKVERDRIMRAYHDQYPAYGFDAHKGYPTNRHVTAIREHGYSPIHRQSFVVKRLVQLDAFPDDHTH